jgi:hypothetical protein
MDLSSSLTTPDVAGLASRVGASSSNSSMNTTTCRAARGPGTLRAPRWRACPHRSRASTAAARRTASRAGSRWHARTSSCPSPADRTGSRWTGRARRHAARGPARPAARRCATRSAPSRAPCPATWSHSPSEHISPPQLRTIIASSGSSASTFSKRIRPSAAWKPRFSSAARPGCSGPTSAVTRRTSTRSSAASRCWSRDEPMACPRQRGETANALISALAPSTRASATPTTSSPARAVAPCAPCWTSAMSRARSSRSIPDASPASSSTRRAPLSRQGVKVRMIGFIGRPGP